MLDPKLFKNSIDQIAARLKTRGFTFDSAKFETLADEHKRLQVKMQTLQSERNRHSKEVGIIKAQGKPVDEMMEDLKSLSEELKSVEAQFGKKQIEMDDFLAMFPNLPHESVPEGKSEEDNQEIRRWGEPKTFSFTAKDHVELGKSHGWIDFETAAALSGARFVVLRGAMAKLHRALAQFMLDLHTLEHGYEEMNVPFIVNAEALFGTGQLPKLKDDQFAIAGEHERYLIPTAEVPLTNLVRGQIIPAKMLPLQFVCHSPCFRSEAGSYGKDLRGMIRLHQFEKVELVHVVRPQNSWQTLEKLLGHAETVLQRLELPYRVMALCTGDLGFSSAKTYDLEVWLPGQQRFREISSCSNMEAFQARRMKARFRDENGKVEWVHTLNGSGLAVGRTLIAVVENYQDALGRIHIPKVLQSYMNGLQVME